MSNKQVIEFTVNCTPQQHEKAWFCVQYRCGILRFWPLVFLTALFLIGAAAYPFQEIQNDTFFRKETLVYCIGCILPIVYFIIAIQYVNKRRRFYLRKYMSLGEQTITVYARSLSMMSKQFFTDVPFADYNFFVEKKEFFLLIKDTHRYLVIPKSDIPAKQIKEVKNRLKYASWIYRLFHKG